MTLTSTQGPLDALVTVLNNNLPTGWVAVDDPTPDVNRVLVEPVTSPNPESVTLGGLPERSTALFQVTGHATSRRIARQAGDAVRAILTGRTGRQPTHPLQATGHLFDPVVTLQDFRLVVNHNTHTFTETYRVTWQADRTGS